MIEYALISKLSVTRHLHDGQESSLHSKRFRASSSRTKKKKECGGRGKGAKETLARKPHDSEKLRSPTNAVLIGAVLVVLIT